MPAKIKLLRTFLVVCITAFMFNKHFLLYDYILSIMTLIIGSIMVFGLWIIPEATGKTKENNEKR